MGKRAKRGFVLTVSAMVRFVRHASLFTIVAASKRPARGADNVGRCCRAEGRSAAQNGRRGGPRVADPTQAPG